MHFLHSVRACVRKLVSAIRELLFETGIRKKLAENAMIFMESALLTLALVIAIQSLSTACILLSGKALICTQVLIIAFVVLTSKKLQRTWQEAKNFFQTVYTGGHNGSRSEGGC